MRILVVEDNEMSRDMLSRRLMRKGHNVLEATNGIDAVSTAQRHSPDLILMDMSLPEVDGWEATRRLKADKSTSHIPIIALTAHAMSGDREKALEAGCTDYATKPVDFDLLLRKIEARGETADDDLLLDLATMREMAEGCGWTLARLGESYMRTSRKEMESLKAALGDGDDETAARVAHGWAGSTSTAGVTGMVEILRQIEEAARRGKLPEAASQLVAAEMLLGRVEEALREATRGDA
jgi:CheY-like chemotaxis protein